MKTFFKYFVTSACIAAVLANFSLQGLANETKTYRPPKGKVREQARKAGGSRGCNIPLDDTVTLLVPQDHTATTVSPYPTFFWHLSQKLSRPLRFTLLEPGKKPILTKEIKPKPGVVALKLPRNSAPLEFGKTYRWTVTIVCHKNKPSRNLFAQAWIERVSLPVEVELFNDRTDTSFCISRYAKKGIWYDALACNYQELIKHPQDSGSSSWQQFQTLLSEIDLTHLARQTHTLYLYQ